VPPDRAEPQASRAAGHLTASTGAATRHDEPDVDLLYDLTAVVSVVSPAVPRPPARRAKPGRARRAAGSGMAGGGAKRRLLRK